MEGGMEVIPVYWRMPEGLYNRLDKIRERKGLKKIQDVLKMACDEYAEKYEQNEQNEVVNQIVEQVDLPLHKDRIKYIIDILENKIKKPKQRFGEPTDFEDEIIQILSRVVEHPYGGDKKKAEVER